MPDPLCKLFYEKMRGIILELNALYVKEHLFNSKEKLLATLLRNRPFYEKKGAKEEKTHSMPPVMTYKALLDL